MPAHLLLPALAACAPEPTGTRREEPLVAPEPTDPDRGWSVTGRRPRDLPHPPAAGDAPDEDGDGDGFREADDCDDADPAVSPAATEVTGDAVDNDCDGAVDCADPDLVEGVWLGDASEVDLDGFCDGYCARTVTGSLVVQHGARTDLRALACLVAVEEDLDVSFNPALTSLAGLDALASIGGWFDLEGNAALTSLAGLGGLASIGEDLDVYANPALTSLAGLDALASIGGDVDLVDNDALASAAGLGALGAIGADLYVQGNDALTSLAGLEALATIEGDLDLRENALLTDVTALHGLVSVGADVLVVDNPALGDPAAQALVDAIDDIGGDVTVGGN